MSILNVEDKVKVLNSGDLGNNLATIFKNISGRTNQLYMCFFIYVQLIDMESFVLRKILIYNSLDIVFGQQPF